MIKLNTPLKVVGIVALAIAAVFFFVTVFPWLLIGVGMFLVPNPPKPEIKYGEFPFRLEYEINGERKIVQDTVICEFEGFEMAGESGIYRKWKSRLKSGNERVTLLKVDKKNMELYFDYGDPEFYMNDSQHGRAGEKFDYNPKIIDFVYWVNGQKRGSAILAEEAWEKYKIRIKSWDYTKPIKNSFPESLLPSMPWWLKL